MFCCCTSYRALLMQEQATTSQISRRTLTRGNRKTFYAHDRASNEGLGGGPPVAASGRLPFGEHDEAEEGNQAATAGFEQQQQQTPPSAQPPRVQTASARHPELVNMPEDTSVAAILLLPEVNCCSVARFTASSDGPRRSPTTAPSPGAAVRTTTMYVSSSSSPAVCLRHAQLDKNGFPARRKCRRASFFQFRSPHVGPFALSDNPRHLSLPPVPQVWETRADRTGDAVPTSFPPSAAA